MGRTGTVIIGRVAGAHGVDGELKVNDDGALEGMTLDSVVIDPDGKAPRALKVLGMRRHGRALLMRVDGVDSRDEARALSGLDIGVDASQLGEPPPGEYYRFDLVGMSVFTELGTLLGEVVEVMATGANDVFVVRGERGEALIPAIDDVVVGVDIGARRMVIRPMEGLVPWLDDDCPPGTGGPR